MRIPAPGKSTMIIARNGEVVRKYFGAVSEADLTGEIDALLGAR